jgi:UDP-N-acetylglucosamine:LPS N-acetylglucosamine transferase
MGGGLAVKRVLFVCSSGGHLDQLLALVPAPEGVEVAVATFLKPDAVAKLEGFRVHGLHWPTNRSVTALFKNLRIALRVLRTERPDIVVSSGAAGAVPFFWVGRLLFRTRNVFIECIDRLDNPTLTARLVRPVTHTFVAQWPEQLVEFPRRTEVSPSR